MPYENWMYTDAEIEAKKKRYPWWRDDMHFPVPQSLCAECQYRSGSSNYGCNYTGVTGESKPVNITLPNPPYCPLYVKGKALSEKRAIKVKRGRACKVEKD